MLSAQLNTYRYDSSTQQWTVANKSNTSIDASTKLRVATLNILHDRYYFPWQAIVRSQERYTHLINELKILQADIVGLNEVTASGLSYLLADDWIRSNYYVSDIPSSNGKRTQQETLGAPHSFLGNLLLSKIPINELYVWRFSEASKPLNRAAVIGVFNAVTSDGTNIKLGVCSIHTSATEKLYKAREIQLEEITHVLDNKLDLSEYYLMGDMNLHFKEEDEQIERLGLIDLWHDTHKFDHHLIENSFTFDAKRNTLVQMTYLNLERRQMRLDRVFWKSKNGNESRKRFHPASELKVWADQPVAENDYLYISDHFGLYLDITTDPDQALDLEHENNNEVNWPQNSFVSLTKRGPVDAGLGMVSAIWNVAKTRLTKLRK